MHLAFVRGIRPAFLFAALLAASLPSQAQLLPRGVADDVTPQLVPFFAATALAVHPSDGGFALYQRDGLSGQGNLRGQRFDVAGHPVFAESVVNDSNDAGSGDVAYDGQGHFVAVWTANVISGRTWSLYTRRVELNGTTTALPVAVAPFNAHQDRGRPGVSCDDHGRCAVIWLEEIPHRQIWLRPLDTSGAPLGEAIPVTSISDLNGEDDFTANAVAQAPDGTVAVLWILSSWNGRTLADARPFVRFFTPEGQPLTGEVQLDVLTQPGPASSAIHGAWNDGGELLASWETRFAGIVELPFGAIHTRLVAANGELRSPVHTIDGAGARPDVAWCGTGERFATFFTHTSLPPDGSSPLPLQELDATGQAVGKPLPAGTANLPPVHTAPRVACDGQGTVWTLWKELADPQGSDAHLRLLGFRRDPPICQGPFEPFPGEIPCGFVGGSGRFLVYAVFRDEAGRSSFAQPINVSHDAAFFAFYDAENPELAIKTVDGTSLNDYFWFFYGALSDREYTIAVFDEETGETRAYYNPLHKLASVGDTQAFPAAAPALAGEATRTSASERPRTGTSGGTAPSFVPQALACPNDPKVLCLPADGFRVTVHWRDFQGHEGDGTAVRLTGQGGWFWFFGPTNLELAVKVLDGRGVNGHFWVFYASLTNVEFTLRVFDEQNNLLKTYTNPSGGFASVADTTAF